MTTRTSQPTRSLRVFLCYSSADGEAVRRLYHQLQGDGIEPWFDEEDLLPGQNWRREIRKAVRRSDVVMVCLSPGAIDTSGYVQKEIRLALDAADEQPEGTIFLIPVKLKPCAIPERLSHLHAVNLFDDQGYQRLLRALRFRARELDGPGKGKLPSDGPSPAPLPSPPEGQGDGGDSLSRGGQSAWLSEAPEALTPNPSPALGKGLPKPEEAGDEGQATIAPLDAVSSGLPLGGGASNRESPGLWPGPFVLPDLQHQGLVRRLTRGRIIQAMPLDPEHILILSTGGALLWDRQHQQAVWDLDCPAQCGAFHPSSGLLALGYRQLLYVWDTRGQFLATLRGHSGRVACLAFSPDARMLASGAQDQTVQVWQLYDETLLYTLQEHTDTVKSVAFAPDSKTLATGAANGTVRLWEMDHGLRLDLFQGRATVNHLAFSPDSELLAVAAANAVVRLWRVSDGERIDTFKGHRGSVLSVAFSPDGGMLASASADRTVRLWRVLDGASIRTYRGHEGRVQSVAFVPGSHGLVSASADQTVRCWPGNERPPGPEEGDILEGLAGYTTSVTSVAFSPDGERVAVGAGNQSVQVWRVADGVCEHVLHRHTGTIRSLAFSPDGALLASGSDDETVQVWQVAEGVALATLRHTDWVRCVVFSPDGALLATGAQDVWLWRVADGRLLQTLKRHPDLVVGIAFAPDGQQVASGSWNGTVRLWNVPQGERLRTLRERDTGILLGMAFLPDGASLVVVSNDRALRLWRMENGVRVRMLKGYKGKLLNVGFAPDGRMIAAGAGDGAVRLWWLAYGSLARMVQGHTEGVQGVAFGPGGRLLVTGSEDGTVRVWHIGDETEAMV